MERGDRNVITQQRLNELSRIYSGSNSDEYRTINELIAEVERLGEEVADLRRSASTYKSEENRRKSQSRKAKE